MNTTQPSFDAILTEQIKLQYNRAEEALQDPLFGEGAAHRFYQAWAFYRLARETLLKATDQSEAAHELLNTLDNADTQEIVKGTRSAIRRHFHKLCHEHGIL